MQRVVGDKAAPHQTPQRLDRLTWIASTCGLMKRVEETGTGRFENSKQLFFTLRERLRQRPLLRQQRQLVGKKQRDASVAFANRLHSRPGNFAGRNQRVKTRRVIVRNARRQNRRLHQRCRQRRSLQALDSIKKRIEVGVTQITMTCPTRREQSHPVREEARQRVLLHRLDLAAQLGERLAPNLAQNFRIAPLAMKGARTESALKHAALAGKLAQRILYCNGIQRKSIRGLAQRERPMGARVAANKLEHRVRHRLQQRRRKPGRQWNSQTIAVAGRILCSNQAPFAAKAQLKQSPRTSEPVDMLQKLPRTHAPRQLVAG